MPSKSLDLLYLKFCRDLADHCSSALRAKVGAILTDEGRIISTGYNGMPSGMDNECEYQNDQGVMVTKKEVIHAEANAILFAAKNGQMVKGSTLYVSYSPCIECAKMIIQAGIKRVVFESHYRDLTGIELLKQTNVICQQIQTNVGG